ncbi:MAG: lamin tail domain-containing protein [Patescibacteria group bacterium]|mgnify:CR=1 FL=1
MSLIGFFLLTLLAVPLCASASVMINEIAWMGSLPLSGETATQAANNEWIELYNSGAADVSLDGWVLEAEDGQPSIALSGSIGAGAYFLLERSDDETVPGTAADLIYTGALGNNGEKLKLKDTGGVVVDTVDATSPPAGGGWPAGDNTTKETMQRADPSAGGWTTGTGTPKVANQLESPMQEKIDAPGASISAPVYEVKKSFIVDAGDDVHTVAGAEVRLSGVAFGESGEPVDPSKSRYLWNFGDGTFFEAQNTNHIYRYPGIYRAALFASSGETNGSDMMQVIVEESGVRINEVAADWIEFFNAGARAVDLSQWQIRNGAGGIFSFPAHTTIGPKALVVFSQETTHLLFGPTNPRAELRYANGISADELSLAGILPADKSIARDEKGNGVIGEKTPGKTNNEWQIADRSPKGEEIKKQIPISSSNKIQNPNDKKENPIIHDISYMSRREVGTPIEASGLQAKTGHPVFASNYFWLAASISMGLLVGAVVLALRHMIL